MSDKDVTIKGLTEEMQVLLGKITSLKEGLETANDLCRSANEIAKRNGAETNWEAFRKKLSISLKKQHIVMNS